jgi:hypothetical protein
MNYRTEQNTHVEADGKEMSTSSLEAARDFPQASQFMSLRKCSSSEEDPF